MVVLGIETSCDESAAAVVANTAAGPKILSNLVHSQVAEDKAYGGIVPAGAARAHLHHLDPIISGAVAEAGIALSKVNGIAAAAGPGLIGGLIVGSTRAKAWAWGAGQPVLSVH